MSSLSGYYRKVRCQLHCSRKLKQKLLADLKQTVSEYQLQHAAASDDEILAFLGPPEEFIQGYLEQCSAAEKKALLSPFRRIIRVIVAAVLFMFLTTAFFRLWNLYTYYTSPDIPYREAPIDPDHP